MLVRSKELLGLPVISLEEGQQLGVVREVVIDREEACIAAIIISPKGFLKESRVLPYAKVQSVGSHAVTVAKATHVDKSLSQQLARLTIRSLEGTRIISDKGNSLGTVDDIIINTESGKIAFLEINGNLIEGILKKQASLATEFIKTLGKDVIIASAEAEANLIYSESSLQHTLKNVGDNTVKILEATWTKTKDLGKNLPLFKVSGFSGEAIKKTAVEREDVEVAEPIASVAGNSGESLVIDQQESFQQTEKQEMVETQEADPSSHQEACLTLKTAGDAEEKINPEAR